ncbi:MAG: PEP-CTERM sorting domain-containing protein [Pirellulales bacterium]
MFALKLPRLILTGLIALTFAAPARAGSFSFQGLGDLPGGTFLSLANAVSADGNVVVGQSRSASGLEAFRWTSGGGMLGLGDLPGGTFQSAAQGVSADGSVVVGEGWKLAGSEAFRWTSGGGMVGLGDLPSSAVAVSADGSVVVGSSSEAFRWTSGGGMVGLGDPPGFNSGFAWGVSADGSVVVGTGTSSLGTEAFRWTSGGGMVGLGDLPGGRFNSYALGVSADGSVVVGRGYSASGYEAFRWTSGGGMVGLGDLPGGDFYSQANGVSADGSVVVGQGVSGTGYEAFRWTSGGGMVNLRDFLVNHGVSNLAGWDLAEARGVSADGRTIVGWGTNPNGFTEAWIATVPEPSTITLAATGLACACLLAARRRRRLRATRRLILPLLAAFVALAFTAPAHAGAFSFQGVGFLSTENQVSRIEAISADGEVAVGYSFYFDSLQQFGSQAFRWTREEGIVGLGFASDGDTTSNARDTSGDGSVIVGASGFLAYRWTSEDGMVTTSPMCPWRSPIGTGLSSGRFPSCSRGRSKRRIRWPTIAGSSSALRTSS